jgi:hypothetical protein
MTDRFHHFHEERLTLGAILRFEQSHGEIFSHCREEYFGLDSHRKIFRRMTMLRQQGKALDVTSLLTSFGQDIVHVGGTAYLMEMHDTVPSLKSYRSHLETLREAWVKREAICRLEAAVRSISDGSAPVLATLSSLGNQLEDLRVVDADHAQLLVTVPEFVDGAPAEPEWLIDGIIERGANGFFVAVPKAGKSFAAIDMALSLALGCSWLGFRVPRPVRCALISREDNPKMTSWRLRSLYAAKGVTNPNLLEANLYINSRAQSPELMVDNPQQVAGLVHALKARQIEFAVFDVFNVLHAADENDNTQMRAILRQLSSIQAQVGCSIGVVHHFNKAENGGLTQRMRGASSIAGWAEWLIGITMADEETKVRRMEFELKAAQPPEPIHYRIESKSESGVCRLVRTEFERPTRQTGSARAMELISR